jgi:peptide/nickel transport system substrate-binding protein
MNHTRLLAAALLIFLFASCGPQPFDFAQGRSAPAPMSVPSPTPSPAPTATSIPHASEIRFALIGNVTQVNVWALFDAKGYSYNNYAVMSGYWPRLYQFSIPDRNFETMAASGIPSPFQQEKSFYTATVPLRSDLKWTDGTPFTADDVAFTVNTAMSFQLGFDWHDFYNPDFIDYAEAVDAHAVKFYFKKQPNVGVWQYGALQGPIVQKAYWESKVSASTALLPPSTLLPQIASLTAQAADMQSKINTVNANIAILPTTSSGYIQGIADIKGLQANLNQINTALAKAQSQYDSAMDAARQSLYALDNQNEPTLGDWMPAGQQNGEWINKVNPAHPFNTPKFDSVSYKIYATEDDTVKAFQNNDVDEILFASSKIFVPTLSYNEFTTMMSFTNESHYLIFNVSVPTLANVAFRQAVDCVIWSPDTTVSVPDGGFISASNIFWHNSKAEFPCVGESDASPAQIRLKQAVQILKDAGYKWDIEPTWSNNPADEIAGKNLVDPSDKPLPSIVLLAISKEYDLMQFDEAGYFGKMINLLGIPLTVQSISPEQLRYDIFSSRQYDMALLGWQLSDYPGYLCDWFKDGNPFGYQSDRLQSACEALNSTSDLTTAQKDVYEIQSILAQDLPFIPLYSGITYDAYRNIKYPFDSVLGGLSGVYGAPSLAIPAP